MKKIFLSLLSLSVFLLSCESSDDDITYVKPDYLSGTWEFSKIGTINAQNVLVYEDYQNETGCEADNLVLKNDNTFVSNDFSTEGINCVNASFSGDFILDNRDLIFNYVIENIEYENVLTIVALTNTEITVSGTNDLGEIVFYKLSKQ
ncbi:lipocalin family protein [Flavobacterium dankookense]|uniref:Lipocalin-like protein n=1 Tax=Flavobacterium dankookense TaxID=706186 RepID=A0A4V3CSD0_9FLAO|nr:lipocalin family protein [Flavobacterium dankookense]TDP60142.1 lipocalin-like protein [Flavobacterium dankookense]